MNKALPNISETVPELRHQIKLETDPHLQQRLQALYLVASGQAASRCQVAALLGFNRNSISVWFTLYEVGGIEKMLTRNQPPGRATLIPEAAAAHIQEVLDSSQGFRTYKEIHELVVTQHNVTITYSAVHKFVRYRLGAKPKSPRPSHPKKT